MANLTKEFKTNPLKFLQKHPVTFKVEGIGVKVKYLKLELTEQLEELKIVSMKEAGAEEERASFYVLAWQENAASTGKLGYQADYFYTGPLTGCMFAVDKNWYTPRVVHVNEQLHNKSNEVSGMNVQGMQKTIATEMKDATSILPWASNPNITVVESHELVEGRRLAIFGWRGMTGTWNFVRQTVKTDGETWSVISVEQLDTWF